MGSTFLATLRVESKRVRSCWVLALFYLFLLSGWFNGSFANRKLQFVILVQENTRELVKAAMQCTAASTHFEFNVSDGDRAHSVVANYRTALSVNAA